MEEIDEKRKDYRKDVEDFLERRHIKKTRDTLVWLRVQKMQSYEVKAQALLIVTMQVEVLDEMIREAEKEEEEI